MSKKITKEKQKRFYFFCEKCEKKWDVGENTPITLINELWLTGRKLSLTNINYAICHNCQKKVIEDL